MVRHSLGLNFVEAVEFIVGSSCVAEARADPAPAAKPTSSDDKTLRIERARKIWREFSAPRNDRRALSRWARARFERRYRKPSDPVSSFTRMA